MPFHKYMFLRIDEAILSEMGPEPAQQLLCTSLDVHLYTKNSGQIAKKLLMPSHVRWLTEPHGNGGWYLQLALKLNQKYQLSAFKKLTVPTSFKSILFAFT